MWPKVNKNNSRMWYKNEIKLIKNWCVKGLIEKLALTKKYDKSFQLPLE